MRFSIVLGVLLIFVPSASGQDLDSEEIRRAMEQGIRHLTAQQLPDGNWGEYPSERCGPTSLAVLALISCGVSKNDPVIERAMNYLRLFRGKEAGQNYAISLQTMAFCLVDPDRDRPLIRENVEYLANSQVRNGTEHDGGWHYFPRGAGSSSDLSNSQFSILALYEAERIGVSVGGDVWKKAGRYWDQTQNPNGSWDYTPAAAGGCRDSRGRGSMTCAGIASLVITSGVLGNGAAAVKGGSIVCSQQTPDPAADKIDKGLDWLARHFSVSQNPNYGLYLYYYLYALERVGRMTNHRFIGDHDWYREGADKLLQLRDSITGTWRGGHSENDVVATSFALLFLSKGRRPVLMSKIRFGSHDSWNTHPNDVNHLTMFAETRWKLDMTWQNIDIDAATTDDLLQSPVLYFSGDRTLLPDGEAEQTRLARKIRGYLDQGGFVIAEAQPEDKGFDAGFRTLMRQVFPEPGYELSLLEPSHPVWTAEMPIETDQLRPMEGIHFGCRTSVIYIPAFTHAGRRMPSLSCLWEVARPLRRDEGYPAAVQRQIDAGLGIGLNLLAYATNRELKFKDQIAMSAARKASEPGFRRGRIFLGLLNQGGGGALAAPRALVNLLQWAETNLGLPVDLNVDVLDVASPLLPEHPILFMHGRESFQFSTEQRERLRRYLESGGFLFADSICSSKAFAESFHNELKAIFPDLSPERIAIDDPVFSDEYGGFRIETLELRIPEQSPGRKRIAPTRNVEPELYGIRIEDRLAVVFSPNDVSCSLEMAGSLECRGYSQRSAMQLAVNVVLYALEHW